MAKSFTDTSIKLGTIGRFEVRKVDQDAPACLVLGRRKWVSVEHAKLLKTSEVQDCLSQFILQYDGDEAQAGQHKATRPERGAVSASLAATREAAAALRAGRLNPKDLPA